MRTTRYLVDEHPGIASRARNQSLLGTLTVGSRKEVEWTCPNHPETWLGSVVSVVRGKSCPYCSYREILVGFNDLSTTHPEFSSELKNSSEALEHTSKSSKKLEWVCPHGHTYLSSPSERITRNYGCSVCSGKTVLCGVNDLATTHPNIAQELLDSEDGHKYTYGSSKKVTWKCVTCSGEWNSTVSNRVKGSGCPYCDGRKPVSGENDFQSMFPDMYAELTNPPLHPLTVGSAYRGEWKCGKGHTWETSVAHRTYYNSQCPVCFRKTSRFEEEVKDFILSINSEIDIVPNTRGILGGLEIDLYLPEIGLGIECHGTYYHQEDFVGKNKHIDKYFAAQEAGITLLQIWDTDWYSSRTQSILKKKLKHHVLSEPRKIFGRHTQVVPLSRATSKKFLDSHHIQGATRVSTAQWGLLYRDDLVAVAVFRRKKEGVWYLDRYAASASVVGGLDKLMKANGSGEYFTYADHLISAGDLYRKTGWAEDSLIPPDYKYLHGKALSHKFNYRIEDFKRRSDLTYSENLSERELAKLNSLYRVYDAGKTRYRKTIT